MAVVSEIILKVDRKQTACNETLAKQEKENLGTGSGLEDADKAPDLQDVQKPGADPIPCLTAQVMVGLRCDPMGSHLPGCRWKS